MTDYPSEWLQGIAEFNQRDYYACHDTLEALWMDAIEPDKKFYQGVLQIAVGCHHLGNCNWQGAVILLGEGMGRLRNYRPEYAGINVSQLIQDSYRLLQLLQSTGSDGISDVIADLEREPTILPAIQTVKSNLG